MPRKCENGVCKKIAILKRPKTEPEVLPEVLPEDKKMRRSYGQYTTDSLEMAIKAVKDSAMSYSKASREFSVPMSTLKDHVNGRCTLGVKPGRRRSIPEEIENSIVDKTIAAAQAGFPITKEQFMLHVELTAKRLDLNTQFRTGVPGDDYWRGVKSRRPDLITRKSDNCNINFKKGLKDDGIDKYFEDLQKSINELGLSSQPSRIWNADEIGIQYCAEPVKVITKRGTQHISLQSGLAKEVNNAFLCINAAGDAMPPILLVKKEDASKSIQKFSIDSTPLRTVWTVQESAWNSEGFMNEWFKDVFLQQCGSDRPQLLIMDSHGSYEILELLDLAHQENIHVLALPPRTSPWLEPLDRGIFMPFQKACRKISLQLLCDNPTFVIDQQTWPGILCQVWDEVMRVDMIRKAFEITGTFPVNKSMIPPNVYSHTQDATQLQDAFSHTTGVDSQPQNSYPLHGNVYSHTINIDSSIKDEVEIEREAMVQSSVNEESSQADGQIFKILVNDCNAASSRELTLSIT